MIREDLCTESKQNKSLKFIIKTEASFREQWMGQMAASHVADNPMPHLCHHEVGLRKAIMITLIWKYENM